VHGVTHGWVHNMNLVIQIISILHEIEKWHEPQVLYKKGGLGFRVGLFHPNARWMSYC
jgi:hypothetical protein